MFPTYHKYIYIHIHRCFTFPIHLPTSFHSLPLQPKLLQAQATPLLRHFWVFTSSPTKVRLRHSTFNLHFVYLSLAPSTSYVCASVYEYVCLYAHTCLQNACLTFPRRYYRLIRLACCLLSTSPSCTHTLHLLPPPPMYAECLTLFLNEPATSGIDSGDGADPNSRPSPTSDVLLDEFRASRYIFEKTLCLL